MSTESTDKHVNGSDKASGCSVSSRNVELMVETLQGYVDNFLAIDPDSVLDAKVMAHALVWLGHTMASNLGVAEPVYDMHTEQMFETGDFYECAKCKAISSKASGHADNKPDICDWCYDTEPTDKGAA